MMVSNRGSVFRLLMWQWRATTFFVVAAVAAVLLHRVGGFDAWVLPALPLGVAGGALGIFVSFRTNSAYDRWWEGRKLWGRLINTSRHFSTQVLSYLGASAAPEAARLVRRHIAYVHVLRCLLRLQPPEGDAEVRAFLGEDEAALLEESNPTHALLHRQLVELKAAAAQGLISEFELQSLDQSLRSLLDIQGGCERIKKTPMPRGYGFIAERLVMAFACLLPFALVRDLGWVTVPINVLVCLAFALISEAGRVLEDPFTMFWNGLPLTALSKTIEHNLRERLGEQDLLSLPVPDARGILM